MQQCRRRVQTTHQGIPASFLLSLCFWLLPLTVVGQVPSLINYQGRLVEGGTLVSGTNTMVFRLYDAPTGGSQLLVETQRVTVVDGLFAVHIGGSAEYGTLREAVTNEPLYLEVQVEATTLDPREQIVSVCYALKAAGVVTGGVSTAMLGDGAVTEEKLAAEAVTGEKIADGSGSNVDLAADSVTAGKILAASFSNTFWKVDGNAGMTDGAHFLGTTDGEALELRVDNTRVLRLEPDADAPRLIGGHESNVARAPGSTVGGGIYNTATGKYSTVSGGRMNKATGPYNAIGGGRQNVASNWDSTVGGGVNNVASGSASVVGGGEGNKASGGRSVVAGGRYNVAAGHYSMAAGRRAKALHRGAFVWADYEDADFASTALDQFLVRAAGGVGIGTNETPEMLTVAGNIAPGQSGTHTLGTGALRWKQLYLASAVDHASDLAFVTGTDTGMVLDTDGNLTVSGAISASAVLGALSNLSSVAYRVGESFVIVQTTTNTALNGDNLITAYGLTTNLTPHGSARGPKNRVTLIVPPDRYYMGTD